MKPCSCATEKKVLFSLNAAANAKGCWVGSRTGRVFMVDYV